MIGDTAVNDNQNMDLFEFAAFAAAESAVKPDAGTAAEVEVPAVIAVEKKDKTLSRAELQQAALAFLVSLHPDAVALNVPTRTSKYRASVAGFWKQARRSGTIVTRTTLVMMYNDIDNCFADCTGKAERMEMINSLQQEKAAMETLIRKNEPHLAAADDLFSEFRSWDYASSVNRDYHKLCRTITRELEILCKGSKLERIRQAGVADQCYLAIPEKLLSPELIPPVWGVVELFPECPRFRLLREAQLQNNVAPEQRNGFALNIASAGAAAVRFSCGVDNDATLRRPPRRRGKLKMDD